MKIIIEPDDGIKPVLDSIRRSRKFLYANFYMIDNKDILKTMQDLQKRGVDVRVIYDGRPYGEANVSGESNVIKDYGLNYKMAPKRFDSPGVFDHAKYFVSDKIAFIGTANASDASFTKNREYMYVTKDRRMRKALKSIFMTDWNNTDDSKVRRTSQIVLSPGSERTICYLISKAKFIETEEMGDDPAVFAALKKRRRLKMILPSSVSAEDRQRLIELSKAGVRVRIMPVNTNYMHAKMIYGDRVFIGSENFSATSLNRNREVGIVFDDFIAKIRIRRSFRKDWKRSTRI